MFGSNFKYSLKILLKNKMLLFWTFIFPIVLGLFFNLAFSDIENSEKLDTFNIAIINNDSFKNNNFYQEAFKELSRDGEDKLFDITYTDINESKSLLDEEKIVGYILFDDKDSSITVKSSGINETILRYVVDEIKINEDLISNLAQDKISEEYKNGNFNINYEEIYKGVYNIVSENSVSLNNISNKNLSYTMIEYYTLIAMAALYGGIIAMFITNYKLPNMSSVGKRMSLAPISKIKTLISSLLASYLVQLVGLFILFIFTVFVLNVDYGDKFLYIVLLALFGAFAGLTLGVFVASIFKTNDNAKTGILIAFTMLGSFLSGMMGITMKYVIDTNIPILNKINPASMITDGLYSLYYYDTLDRYLFNIISLIIFSVVMLLISSLELRRQKYDSI